MKTISQKVSILFLICLISLAITGYTHSHWADIVATIGTVEMGHLDITIYNEKYITDHTISTSKTDNNETVSISATIKQDWQVWVGIIIKNNGTLPATITYNLYTNNDTAFELYFTNETHFYGPYTTIPPEVWDTVDGVGPPPSGEQPLPIGLPVDNKIVVWQRMTLEGQPQESFSITITSQYLASFSGWYDWVQVEYDLTDPPLPPPPPPTPPPRKLYLAVRGMDDKTYYQDWDETSWNGWTLVPGATSKSPAAAILNNNLHIVVRGTTGAIWHGYVNLTDSTFSGWSLLSGATPSAPTLAASATSLYLVVRGNDDRIYYRSWDGATWLGWTALPGATANRPAAAVLHGNLHVVVNGLDGEIYHGYVDLSTSVFSGWNLLSGSTPSPPELAASATKLYLVVRGNDNKIYYRSWDGSWDGWTALPGATVDGPAAAVLGGNLHVVVRGTDGNMYHGYLDLTNGWTPWTKLSGATPSAPELAT